MSFVDFYGARRARALVLELVLLGRVPEHGIVHGRDGEILGDSPIELGQSAEIVCWPRSTHLIQAGTRSIRFSSGRVMEI